MKLHKLFVLAFSGLILFNTNVNSQSPTVTIQLDQKGFEVPTKLYGLMTEEINYSYDGGLYAELIRNRSFKDNVRTPDHWTLVQEGDAKGIISLDRQNPVNDILSVSLKLDAQNTGSRIGIANDGYWGIPVRPKTTYTASFYAKASKSSPLKLSIESTDGKTVYAEAQTKAIGSSWQQYQLILLLSTPKQANLLRLR